MTDTDLFCHLTSDAIADFIREAQGSVCYAGPGIQIEPALAMYEVAQRIGPELLTVSLDFNERIFRMGYGDIAAVKKLQDAGIVINDSAGLRSALIIVDGDGYTFTPTPLYLEAETNDHTAPNAMRLSRDQISEALARLSPAAKVIAIAQAKTIEEKERISKLPVEVGSIQVGESQLKSVENNLKEAPPVEFDLARQMQVFEPYLQYVEMSLTGAAIQRHKLAIPASIQKLGGSEDLKGRLKTTFDLIEKGGKLSSKSLEDTLNEIRKNFTPTLGKDHGRVVLKVAKPHLDKRLKELSESLVAHKAKVALDLKQHLEESKQTIIDYYAQRVIDTPPDALLGQSISGEATLEGANTWLELELDRVFPSADSLIQEMKLDVRYKDVTFETLNRDDFLESVKNAFPHVDWDKAYAEFIAAGENNNTFGKNA
jgi:hypothetical protein